MEIAKYTLEPGSHGDTTRGRAAKGSAGADKVPQPPANWRIDLHGMSILAFGGGGSLSEHFLTAAAGCGARVAIADFLPEDPDAARTNRERILNLARRIASIKNNEIPERTGKLAEPEPELPPVIFGDVRKSADVKVTVDYAAEKFGTIDIGIDFAGIHHRPFDLAQEAAEALEESFRNVIDINLHGAFLITAHLARRMAAQRRGHIIHLCSNGSRASLYGSYAYNASKHGLEGLVKTAAAQMAPYGVRVNAIAPGTVETNLNRELLRDETGELRPRARSILAHTPSKKFCTREGVTATMLSMCIPQPHFTGNVVFADDGYNIEGHSWPEGNQALFAGQDELEDLFTQIDSEFPGV